MTWLLPFEYGVTNMSSMLQYVNYLTDPTGTGGWFGIFICAIIFLVTFIASKDQETSLALAYASVVSSICALFLRVMGVVTTKALILFVVFAIIASIYYKLQDE